MHEVAVVVLNWNNAVDSLECLESLRRSNQRVSIIVVDNGSTDGSDAQIRASGLADIVLQSGGNLGYAGGNNVGLRYAIQAGFESVCVLNNDTVVEPEALGTMFQHLSAGGDLAVSPRIDYFHSPGTPWFAGGVIDRGMPLHLQPDEVPTASSFARSSETLSGCCVMALSDTWHSVGLFDERYFLIFEDSDWSMRARRCGVALRVLDSALIHHKVSRSFSSGPASLLGCYYHARNGVRFHRQYGRRYIPHFVSQWVVRPSLRAGRAGAAPSVFRLLGAFAGCAGPGGRAPRPLARLAQWIARGAKAPPHAERSDRLDQHGGAG
jgi:GT2 family glycosyltransferase